MGRLIFAKTLAVGLALGGCIPSTSSQPTLEVQIDDFQPQYQDVKRALLESPHKWSQHLRVPRMGIIALSNAAEGLVGTAIRYPERTEEVQSLLEKAVETALDSSMSPYEQDTRFVDELGNYGLYLSHLNIILGAHERMFKDNQYQNLNQRISNHLASKILSDPQSHARSYSSREFKWPADQTATLYSLWLFDQNNGTTVSDLPIKSWLNYMKESATDPKTGLHRSEVTVVEYGKYPRGCALSWSIIYMSNFAPEEAKELWEKYKEHFKQNSFFAAGFREWPKGVDRKSDVDSGPIVQGFGVSATAFGLCAARAVDDTTTYEELDSTNRKVRDIIESYGSTELKRLAKDLLAQSITLKTRTLTDWY